MQILNFLYNNPAGRILLKPLTSRPLSALCGRALDSTASKRLIPLFVKRAGIDTSDYDLSDINSFNDFFARPIKRGRRVIDMSPEALIAPCDGRLQVSAITDSLVLPVKQSEYSLASLLRSKALAKLFEGGYALVYRLSVDNYHRYIYFDSGTKAKDVTIDGILHTVQPIALRTNPVFSENSREYSLIESENFGTAVQLEVGAMLVGRIANEMPGAGQIKRGDEKGHFEYGGSTVIVLIQKDAAKIRGDIVESSSEGLETPVLMGECIGTRL